MIVQIIKMFFDGYSRKARLFPTIIIFSPIILLSVLYCYQTKKEWIERILALNPTMQVAVVSVVFICFVVIVWLGSFFIRNRGKNWEERIFRNGCGFPTTQLLMWKDRFFSEDFKQRLHSAIKADFLISLPNQKDEERALEKTERTIKDVVDLIRPRVADGRIVIQDNTQYGFVRNTLASIDLFTLEWVVLIALAYLSKQNRVYGLACIAISVCSGLLWICRKRILLPHATRYANTLFHEYYEQRGRDASIASNNNPRKSK